jgi:hypothetical protein
VDFLPSTLLRVKQVEVVVDRLVLMARAELAAQYFTVQVEVPAELVVMQAGDRMLLIHVPVAVVQVDIAAMAAGVVMVLVPPGILLVKVVVAQVAYLYILTQVMAVEWEYLVKAQVEIIRLLLISLVLTHSDLLLLQWEALVQETVLLSVIGHMVAEVAV